jgi:hypothetical protein
MHTVKTLIEALQAKLDSGECEPNTPVVYNMAGGPKVQAPMQIACLTTMGGFKRKTESLFFWEPEVEDTVKLVFLQI